MKTCSNCEGIQLIGIVGEGSYCESCQKTFVSSVTFANGHSVHFLGSCEVISSDHKYDASIYWKPYSTYNQAGAVMPDETPISFEEFISKYGKNKD